KIRNRILQIRNALSLLECTEKSAQIMHMVKQQEEYTTSKLLFLYASYQNEVMTGTLILEALREGKRIALPCAAVTNGVPQLDFYEITDISQLADGYRGIPEPDKKNKAVRMVETLPDLLLLPGVAFDRQRNRIGYGMGFYDHYFTRQKQVRAIAVAYECQVVSQIPVSGFDYRPDKLITEERIYQ
ncbi:MAG TPA: 5-formyltetrahydrofolate cyclo-ligase, partial [Lachnospiraceae bacterium]|nr:5-formyltetrahydrofolate cyclo-ligase [Lachnospiraceae bacterium]